MRTVYVNGEYVPENEAKVSIFDRGFLFADGVYEVTSVIDGKLLAFDGHIERLKRSLSELDMNYTVSTDEMLEIHQKLVDENNLTEGLIYLQVTRGAADRDFAYPSADTPCSVVLFTQSKNLLNNPQVDTGISVATIEDQRWARRDIKTVQLLYPSMAKMAAKAQGADDAWLVTNGYVNEGSSNNAWIVTKDNVIVTRDLSNDILHGITRAAVLKCADLLQMKVEERAYSVEEAYDAAEAFCTSASGFVMPIVKIDDAVLGSGTPGSVAKKLREVYLQETLKTAI